MREKRVISLVIRCFSGAFAVVVGLMLGLGCCVVGFDALWDGKITPVRSSKYELRLLPDAQGVRKVLPDSSPLVVVLPVRGVFGEGGLRKEPFIGRLQELFDGIVNGRDVRGVVLNIDSPGGDCSDIYSIYDGVRDYATRLGVPLYAFIGGDALSGGYQLALAADRIWASRGSLIGGIGTISSTKLNYHKPLERLGIESVTVCAGEGKDLLNPLRPWGEGEDQPLREVVSDFYDQFVDQVVSRRPRLTREIVVNEVQAKLFHSTRAKEIGLIDEDMATMSTVLAALVKEVGLEEGGYQVVTPIRKKSVFQDVVNVSAEMDQTSLLLRFAKFLGIELHQNRAGITALSEVSIRAQS